ncbi:glycosyltransferase [Rubrivirga sp.]|uniref:glycosyltransferase n=1 Tax=Rubrivirga sp. TaxID=1885344 RepID=UPI003C714D91
MPTALPTPSLHGRHATFTLLGDVTGSSRALRQIRALRDLGLEVDVVQVDPPRAPAALEGGSLDGLEAVGLTALEVTGQGPLLFAKAHRAMTQALASSRSDLYLASDLYTLPAASSRARASGAALVYDSRELYTALDSSAGKPWVSAVWRAVESRTIRHADAVLTVGDAIADRLEGAYGIDRPTVLYNAPDAGGETDRDALARHLGLPDDGRMVVLYQGLFRSGRGIPSLLEATRRVQDMRLVLIGEGVLEDEIGRADLGDRLVVSPFIPPDRLATLTPGADLGACLIEPLTESLRLSLPNKLFEYLAAGVPILASPLPEIEAVVGQGVGVLADPSDPTAVAAALRRALDAETRVRWREKTASVLDPYTWTRGRATFQALVASLLS